jgi:hypothetical protein
MWYKKLKLWESYGNLSQSEAHLRRLWRQTDGKEPIVNKVIKIKKMPGMQWLNVGMKFAIKLVAP